MKHLRSIFIEMVLPLVVSWLLMTILVDIVAIPNVFRNVSNLSDGGRIGMAIFSRFNSIEVALAFFICTGILAMKKAPKALLFMSIILLALSFLYNFYMTPMITNVSVIMSQLSDADPQFLVLVKKHRAYHDLYRGLDTAKMILLFIFAGILLRLKLMGKFLENV